MLDVFVIGTASLDTLHLEEGQTVQAAGGAGLYTAVAVQQAGGRAGLFAPRPDPMPEPLQPIAARVTWIGPTISPDELPRLEIAHHGGGKATLVRASWGAEGLLQPDSLPPEMGEAAYIHIAALSSAERQRAFLEALPPHRHISVGTYARLVYGNPDGVRALLEQADLFFMNENEANGLFGSVAQAQTRAEAVLFVTLGERGARVIKGTQVTDVPGQPAEELDPTGAGDTFCGAVLAHLARGASPVAAASEAVRCAARAVEVVGPYIAKV